MLVRGIPCLKSPLSPIITFCYKKPNNIFFLFITFFLQLLVAKKGAINIVKINQVA